MESDFPYLVVPDRLKPIVGEPDPRTRVYRRKGSDEDCGAWYDALVDEYPKGFVSPGGVSMFAPVSRAGVHKRMKEGKLTTFCFHIVEVKRTLFGYQKRIKQRPYLYVPVSECKAWGERLKARPDRKEAYLEAHGGEKPDVDGEFLDKDPRDKGKKDVKYEVGKLTREELVMLVKGLVDKAIDEALPEGMRRKRQERRGEREARKWEKLRGERKEGRRNE